MNNVIKVGLLVIYLSDYEALVKFSTNACDISPGAVRANKIKWLKANYTYSNDLIIKTSFRLSGQSAPYGI